VGHTDELIAGAEGNIASLRKSIESEAESERARAARIAEMETALSAKEEEGREASFAQTAASKEAEALSFDTIAVSGKNSSMPHGVPSDKAVEDGDFITMDFGAVVDGYHSDMTRTVAVGFVTDEQRLVYDTVLKAQCASLDVIRAGVSCFDADKAARDVIVNAGYGEYFGHGTGHGVGVEIHESPNLSPRSISVLETGNIVTVEPGIYLPGKFGVRTEDMVFVTADGCENLTKSQKSLIVL
jgi:Xaa-Pro aminopeptidase